MYFWWLVRDVLELRQVVTNYASRLSYKISHKYVNLNIELSRLPADNFGYCLTIDYPILNFFGDWNVHAHREVNCYPSK